MREASSFFMYMSVQPLMLMAGKKKSLTVLICTILFEVDLN